MLEKMSRIFFYLWLYLGERTCQSWKKYANKMHATSYLHKTPLSQIFEKNILNNNNDKNLLISPNVYK